MALSFKLTRANYESLRKMTMRERMQVAEDREVGTWLLSMLSPTEFASLFPLYYRRTVLPDISGFRMAMPTSMSAAKQAQIEEQLRNTASGSAAGANMEAGGWKRKYQSGVNESVARQTATPTKAGAVPEPQLSPEQKASYDALQQAPMAADDPRAKMFSNIPADKLANAGISKIKKDGKEYYQYTAPTVSEEEKRNYIKDNAGAGSNANVRQRVAWYRQYAASKGLDPDKVTGIVLGEGAVGKDTKPWGNWDVRGYSFGDFQLFTAGGLGNRFMKAHPDIPLDKAHWKEQGKFAIDAMAAEGDKAWYSVRDADPLRQKDWERGRAAITQKGKNWWSTNSVGPDPIAADYSEKNLELAQRGLLDRKKAAQIRELAQYTTAEGMQALPGPQKKDEVTTIGESVGKGASIGGWLGESKQCVALSKHFAPNIGRAREWNVEYNPDGIVPGAVIATTNYGKGPHPGGVMARDMPDHQSHYHTGIALTRPDAAGNVLILDQSAGKGTSITRVNINNYHGEKWGPVAGGAPTERSLKAIEMAKSLASPEQLAVINGSTTISPAAVAPPAEKVNKDPTTKRNEKGLVSQDLETYTKQEPMTPTAPPTKIEGAPGKDGEPGKDGAPGKDGKTAIVTPQPTASRYKLNMSEFRNMIKNDPSNSYPGWMIDMASDSDIVDGFNKDPRIQAAGVHIDNKGVLHIKDTNNPGVKEFMAGKDMSKVMSKIEEKKPEVKPIEQKPVEKKAEPATPAPTSEPKKEEKKADVAPPKVEEKKADTKPADVAPAKVKTNALGGSNKVDTEQISAYPIGGIKSDNVVVVNKQQRPLFTMNTNEKMMMDPATNTARVLPNSKDTGIRPSRSSDVLGGAMQDFTNAITDLRSSFTDNKIVSPNKGSNEQVFNDTGMDKVAMHDTNDISRVWYQSPSMQRATYRAAGVETGEPINNFHFSHGNRS